MTDGQIRLTNALYGKREHKLRPRQVAGTIAFAARLGWQADRRRFITVLIMHSVQPVGLGAGLLALRGVLGRGLAAQDGTLQLSAVAGGLIALAAIGLVSTVTGLVAAVQQQVLQSKISALACDRVTQAVAAADLRTFEDTAFHDRVEHAVWAARDFAAQLATAAITVLGTVLRVAAVTVAVATMAWWLLPVLLAAATPIIRVALWRQRGDFALRLELMENRRTLAYLLQLLTGRDTAKEIRAFDLAGPLRARMAIRYTTAIEAERRFQRIFLWRAIGARLLSDLVLAGIVAGVLTLVGTGRLNLATALTTLTGAYLLSGQLRSLASMTSTMGSPVLFVQALRGFIDSAPPNPAPPSEPETFTTLTAEHLTFTYPAAQTPALNDISIELRADQVIALVGENGSGKTTLAKILTGLYEPDTGTLRWDGEPIHDPARLRASSTVLFQDFARYKLTGIDNIGLGRPDRLHDHQAIQRAAEQAGAHGILNMLPNAYQTILSTEFTGGIDLSTGQWQRVALARAYFRDAPFLVLDEPTAALDPKAEADLFAHLHRLHAGRTTLLITHRIANVRHADHIYVLEHGCIIEHGTHTQLLARGGTYANLFHTQAQLGHV